MRRFAKMIPQEISLTQEGANRRVIATYKSRQKPQQAAAATPTTKSREDMDIKEAIENTPNHIVEALLGVTKSVTANGKQYTPQAASVSKAIGRMIAPFSDELSLSDLVAIGKAAGLAGDDGEPTKKSVGKGDPDEDDTEAGGADQGKGMAPKMMDFDEDEEDEEEAENEEEIDDEEEDEEDEPEEGEAPTPANVKKAVSAENIAPKAKKDDTDEDAEAESGQPAAEDEEAKSKIKPANAQAWGQPKGTKAKGETVAKSATSGSPASDERYTEIRKSLERQEQENEQLREAIAKTRKDLDEERGFRALEAIKKSVKADYAHLNVDVDALAPVLKSLKESPDNTMFEQLTATLKAADAQVKAAQAAGGIFQAVGKSSARSAAAGAGASWSDKIEARVEEEFKKSANGRVKAQVYDQFIETDEGREMLHNHRAEMAQTRGF